MALFELLTRASIQKVSLAGFEISDLSGVRKVLPLLVAYYLYEIVFYGRANLDYQEAHRGVLDSTQLGLIEKGLDYFLEPQEAAIAGSRLFGSGGLANRLSEMISGVILFGIIAFEIYAFRSELILAHWTSPFIWVLLAVSAFLVAMAVITAFHQPNSQH